MQAHQSFFKEVKKKRNNKMSWSLEGFFLFIGIIIMFGLMVWMMIGEINDFFEIKGGIIRRLWYFIKRKTRLRRRHVKLLMNNRLIKEFPSYKKRK